MNLYQKIVEVRKVAGSFSKDAKGFNYKYVSGNQVLGKITEKMNELNLLLFPTAKLGEHHEYKYKTAKGKDVTDIVVSGEMSYTWVNGDDPIETHTLSWAYYGQNEDISKAFGSALTYSERYFLLKCLGLPTDEDDPDSKIDKPTSTPGEQYTTTPQTQPDAKVITTKQLIDIASKKGYSEKQLLAKYNINEIKFMKQADKKAAYEGFMKLPDKAVK